MTSTLQIPAELQAAPPRRVARCRRHGETWWQRHRATVRWLIVAVIGFGLSLGMVSELTLLLLAPTQQATIKALTVSKTYTSKGGPIYHYEVTYSYHAPDDPGALEGSGPITADEYDALRGKHSMMIHVGPSGGTTLHRTFWRYVDARWFLWFVAVGLDALAVTLFRREWLRRRQVRKLASEGRPVLGRIISSGTDKSAWTYDAYMVKYEFSLPDSASKSSYTNCVPVRRRTYERMRAGQSVVVIYDPRHPSQSILYDLCDYYVKP